MIKGKQAQKLALVPLLTALVLMSTGFATSPARAAKPVIKSDHMVAYKSADKFEDVVDAVKFAIGNRGIVINYESHIASMLNRTGKDLGESKQPLLDSLSFEFCSAVVSRDTMEADPHNIVFCPYIIIVYVIPDDPKHVYVGYRRPRIVGNDESKKSLRAVEKLLDDIAQEALAW